MKDRTIDKDEEGRNRERYEYYSQPLNGTYNYGIKRDDIFYIYRRSDNHLLMSFSLIDFKTIKNFS